MNCLVTGGAGFIGSHVVDSLLSMGHGVVALDDLSGGTRDNVWSDATFLEGDVCDSTLVDDLFERHRFDVVFHLGAYAAEGLSHFIRRFNYTNNLVGSATILNASVNTGVRRLVFTSSIAVYGAGQLPMTEAMAPAPEDPYGIAKYAVELDLRAAFHLFGLEYVIFRPHNVYGERQNIGDPYRNVVGIFMNRILQGQPLPVFGDGRQTRAFSYIGDIAPVIARAGFEDGAQNEVFNIGADQPTSVLDLAAEVSRALDVACQLEFHPARQEVVHAFSSHEKVRRVFGEAPGTPLRDGLARMAQWARAAGIQRSKAFDSIEVSCNLPEAWRSLGS